MKKLVWLLLVIVLCLLGALAALGQRATLVALEPLSVHQGIDGQMAIAQVASGTRLPVIRCIDTKSLIIPEVLLADGRTGYAVYGRFQMERAPLLDSSIQAPISFSCP